MLSMVHYGFTLEAGRLQSSKLEIEGEGGFLLQVLLFPSAIIAIYLN